MNSFEAIRALIFILPAVVAGWVFRPQLGEGDDGGVRLFAGWLMATALAFILQPGFVLFFLLAIVILATQPSSPGAKGGFFLVFLFCLPKQLGWLIPFPGVNYLIDINMLTLTVMVFFFLAQKVKIEDGGKKTITTIFITYSLVLIIGDLRDWTTFTNEIRNVLIIFIETTLLFLIGRRLFSQVDSDRTIIRYYVIMCVLFIAANSVSVLKQWEFYEIIKDSRFGYGSRGGRLRLDGPYVGTLLGTLTVFFAYALYLWRKEIGLMKVGIWGAASFITILFCGSRGAILSALVVGFVHIILRFKGGFMQAFAGVAGVAGAAVMAMSLSSGGLDKIDQYGTFTYRQRLLEMAWQKLMRSPLFGDSAYESDPFFEPLRQGQGIVDFVNIYVQVGLGLGFLGLALFFGMAFFAVKDVMGVVNRLATEEDERSQEMVRYGRWLVTFIISYAIMMATISNVSYIGSFYVILIAMAQGFVHQTQKQCFTQAEPQPQLAR